MRAYALALSFDPVLSQDYAGAMRMESAFGTYFLVPFLMAMGILLLEASLVPSRVFPTPPAPVSVSKGDDPSSRTRAWSSLSRPMKLVTSAGRL